MKLLCRFFAVLTAALLALPSIHAAELRTLDGKTVNGDLVSIDATQAVITAAGGQLAFPLKEILTLQIASDSAIPTATKPAVWLELTDGSMLAGADIRVVKSLATLTVAEKQSIELPVKALRAIRFADPSQDSRQWAENLAGKSTADLIAVRKKDNIDFLEGVIGDIDAEAVRFTLDGDAVPVKRAKVAGLIYFRRNVADQSEAAIVVEDRSGLRVYGKSLALEDNAVSVTTVSGVRISRPLEEIAKIDLSAGKLMFLGDMKEDSYERKSYFDFGKAAPTLDKFYRLRQNQAQEGQLRLAGKPYLKGIQVYSQSTTVYRLPPKSKTFRATVGIDDAVTPAGRVRLQIFGDENKLFDEPISGADKPRDLELDLAGARKLRIVVNFGEDQDVADHLDLCDARILK